MWGFFSVQIWLYFHIDINYSMLKKHNNDKRTLKIYSVYQIENDLFIKNYSIDETAVFKITFLFYIKKRSDFFFIKYWHREAIGFYQHNLSYSYNKVG